MSPGLILVAVDHRDARAWTEAHPEHRVTLVVTRRSHARARGRNASGIVVTPRAVMWGVLDHEGLRASVWPTMCTTAFEELR